MNICVLYTFRCNSVNYMHIEKKEKKIKNIKCMTFSGWESTTNYIMSTCLLLQILPKNCSLKFGSEHEHLNILTAAFLQCGLYLYCELHNFFEVSSTFKKMTRIRQNILKLTSYTNILYNK